MVDLAQHTRPYVKTLGSIGNQYTVWAVDGGWIRKHMDPTFSNVGHSYLYPHVPQGELWLDWTTAPEREWPFFIHRMMFEIELMKSGLPYPEASKLSAAEEQKERAFRKQLPAMTRADYAAVDPRQERIGVATIEGFRVKVFLVDGETVRDVLDTDYFSGGHGLINTYMPEDEIWIESFLDANERLFTLYHEVRENRAMRVGGKTYEQAHVEAALAETAYRNHPENLWQVIRSLGYVGGLGKPRVSKGE
jgi:hypothetical protein